MLLSLAGFLLAAGGVSVTSLIKSSEFLNKRYKTREEEKCPSSRVSFLHTLHFVGCP